MKPILISAVFACMLMPPLAVLRTSSAREVTVRSAVAPVYPPLAATTNTSGEVEIAVRLDADGKVTSAEVVSGHPLLQHAALEAAKRWKFEGADDARKVHLTFCFRIMPNKTSEEDMTPVFTPAYRFEVRRKLPEPTVNYGQGR